MYDYLWYFILFSVLGWCMEVIYHTVSCGEFSNRGFLNGPVCPIYGVGAVALIVLLRPLSENVAVLFVGAFVITSAIEFVTGYVLEKIFHMKWWDYSNVPFNLKGYICLKFSLGWGIVGVLLMRVVLPLCEKLIWKIPSVPGIVFLFIVSVCYVSDAVFTVFTLRSLKKRIKIAEKISVRLRHLSDEIGIHLSNSVFDLMEKADELIKSGKAKTEDIEALKREYKEKILKPAFGHKRLIRAFPSLSSKRYKHSLEQIKKVFGKTRKRNGADGR